MAKSKSDISVSEETKVEVEAEVIACSLEDVESHLRAFIATFVLPHAQSRWLEFLIERRPEWDTTRISPRTIKMHTKARAVLRDFAVDLRFCKRISNAQRSASDYSALVGTKPGVYFHLDMPPCQMTATDADTKFSWDNSSALLSFKAGKKVLYFHHDDGVWLFEKS